MEFSIAKKFMKQIVVKQLLISNVSFILEQTSRVPFGIWRVLIQNFLSMAAKFKVLADEWSSLQYIRSAQEGRIPFKHPKRHKIQFFFR